MENNLAFNQPFIPGKNGGRLNPGGTPGNKGGPGAPSSAVRKASRESYERGLEVFNKILGLVEKELKECTSLEGLERLKGLLSDVLRGTDMSGKYGLGEPKIFADDEVLEAVSTGLANSSLTSEQMEDALTHIHQALKDRA